MSLIIIVLTVLLLEGLSLGVLVSWLFSTPIQFWLAGHLYSSAFKSLFYAHKANVDCLVMLSSSSAYVYSTLSVIVSLAKGHHTGKSSFLVSQFIMMVSNY